MTVREISFSSDKRAGVSATVKTIADIPVRSRSACGMLEWRQKPTGSLYHLSHGQREPVSFASLSLPEANGNILLAKTGPIPKSHGD
ncbi:MAG TPA: hypothetical protein VN688_27350 [Gemmataceae bacterium]|nr:hypothetical protein [Gemmataceae bacterium]